MTIDQSLKNYDLTFAGGGFSTAISLTYLLRDISAKLREDRQLRDASDRPPFSIAVFDEAGRFPKGIAYSEDKDSGAFVITPASEMMPPYSGGGNELTDWLSNNPAAWIEPLSDSRSSIVKEWLPSLIEAVERRDFNRVFVPRAVIGWFIDDLVTTAMADTEGYVRVDVLSHAIDRVQRLSGRDGFLITTEEGDTIGAKQCVVAVGSGQFGALSPESQGADWMIDAPLKKGLSALRHRLEASLGRVSNPRVLVIGSNASALDVISTLIDLENTVGLTARVTSISPSGQFPPKHHTVSASDKDSQPCLSLADLLAVPNAPTARQIYDSAVEDRSKLINSGRNIGEAKAFIYSCVLKLIERLDVAEKQDFVEVYGNDLSRQFYMTSPIYSGLYSSAIKAGKLSLLAGKVRAVSAATQCAEVEYTRGDEVVKDQFDLVIDCSGFEFPLAESSMPLIQSLFDDLDAQQNRSGRGFVTRADSFEIAESIFVIGPLYAGNVDSTGVCRWHLETTRGIAEIAGNFSKEWVSNFLQSKVYVPELAKDIP